MLITNSFLEDYQKIINEIAEKCIEELNPEVIETLRKYPNSSAHHFGYEMYIRNRYIYNHKDRVLSIFADNLSGEIVKLVLLHAVPGYDIEKDDILNVD